MAFSCQGSISPAQNPYHALIQVVQFYRATSLEMVGHTLGFMHGPRTRGRKPERMNEAYPELQVVFRELLKKQLRSSS